MYRRESRKKVEKAFFTAPTPRSRWNFTYTPSADEWRIWDRTGKTPSQGMDSGSFFFAAGKRCKME